MTAPVHFGVRRLASVGALLMLSAAIAGAQERILAYEGQRLADALLALQNKGLRIVFSSEIVTPSMRVTAEPRATQARRVLDELLKPHRLKAEQGPGGVLQVVRATPAKVPAAPPRPAAGTTGSADPPPVPRDVSAYNERVTVTAPLLERQDPGIGFETRARIEDIRNHVGVLADDPMQAVHALPHVATGDDFRSEFSVRGSPYRALGIVVDGVATPWLQHAVHRGGETGSISMLNSRVIEQATLQAGAYPRRHGDGIGAQLEVTLREGSRMGTRFSGGIGGTSATLVGEGPLGRLERGSWLLSLRQSYREWPSKPLGDLSGTAFGFGDAQAKLVYDVRPSQQVRFTLLGGHSRVDERGNGQPNDLAVASNQAMLVSVGWRSVFSPSLVLSQRVSLVSHRLRNRNQANEDTGTGSDQAFSYRADVTRAIATAVVEGGVQVQRLRGARLFQASGDSAANPSSIPAFDRFDGSSWLRAGFLHVKWAATPRLTIAPGVRVSDSTLVHRRTMARWVLGAWSLRPGWTLNASAGTSYALPELAYVLGGTGAPDLEPERASHVDVGIEHRFASSVRWRATVFDRVERNVLLAPDSNPRLVGGVLVEPNVPGRYENALDGSARGLELLLERSGASPFSGWIAYSYGKTRQTDRRGDKCCEAFWADFDQRHAVNASGLYRLSDRTMVVTTFRSGTNFPIPGYLTERSGELVAGERRNEVRLPAYARLDVRVSRTFDYTSRRLTLFVEVLNVLNHRNVRMADGFIRRGTGEASGFTQTLFPRLPSAGVLIEF